MMLSCFTEAALGEEDWRRAGIPLLVHACCSPVVDAVSHISLGVHGLDGENILSRITHYYYALAS